MLSFALLFTLALAEPAAAKRIVGTNRANTLVGTAQRDEIVGRGGRDVILGGPRRDRLYGDEGDDIVLGEAGHDRIWGGGRDDTLDGGAGRDRIWAGWGTDVVEAGRGNDLVYATENDGALDSVDCGPGIDRAILSRHDLAFNCERVTRVRGSKPSGRFRWGTPGDDEKGYFKWYGHDFIVGFGGNDKLNGHSNADMLWGNEGNDDLDGDLSPDFVLGGPGRDTVKGNNGLDRLWGGMGLDTLLGGHGNDEIISIAHDRVVDVIDCGPGRHDRVVARSNDKITHCERVIRIR